MDLNTYRANPDLEKKGVWRQLEDARFLIASSASPAYRTALTNALRKLSPKERKDPAALERVTIDCMAKHALLSFEGLTDNGQPMEPTPENRRKVLEVAAVREWVAEQCNDLTNFQEERDAADMAESKSSAPVAD